MSVHSHGISYQNALNCNAIAQVLQRLQVSLQSYPTQMHSATLIRALLLVF